MYQENSNRVIQLDQLDLSKMYRETERYTYGPDGALAAYELEREQVAQASLSLAGLLLLVAAIWLLVVQYPRLFSYSYSKSR